MQKQLFVALAAAGVLALTGCQTTEPPKAAAPAVSPEAKAAIDKAEADVKQATSKGALWTTAEAALKAAKDAAAKGDNATAIRQANLASEHVKLGLEQKGYKNYDVK